MHFAPLPRAFYEPSARSVAPALLGHWLISHTGEGFCGGPIVETEAYLQGDAACHAVMGPTPRNQVMFGPPGHAYVYFIYGAHYCVNAVCQPSGVAEAVLIRAIEPQLGRDLLRKRRPSPTERTLTNGPAKLCEAMGIDRTLNGTDLCHPNAPLLIACNPNLEAFLAGRGRPVTTRRIGITRAADLPLRFYLPGSQYVSKLR